MQRNGRGGRGGGGSVGGHTRIQASCLYEAVMFCVYTSPWFERGYQVLWVSRFLVCRKLSCSVIIQVPGFRKLHFSLVYKFLLCMKLSCSVIMQVPGLHEIFMFPEYASSWSARNCHVMWLCKFPVCTKCSCSVSIQIPGLHQKKLCYISVQVPGLHKAVIFRKDTSSWFARNFIFR